jgi:hypothetical protein
MRSAERAVGDDDLEAGVVGWLVWLVTFALILAMGTWAAGWIDFFGCDARRGLTA